MGLPFFMKPRAITLEKFKLIIPDKYINDNNRNDFNKFMSHAYKQTIDKTVLGLEKTQRKLLIEHLKV